MIDEREIAIKAAIAASILLLATPVDAHCYSVWKYPWPQRCHATATRTLRPALARAVSVPPPAPVATPVTPVTPVTVDPPPQAVEALRVALNALMLQRAGRIVWPQEAHHAH